MSVHHMEPLAQWGKNSHSVPKQLSAETGIKDYICYHIPRKMFRQAASTFSDVRHADQSARYDEMCLQLILQTLFESGNLEQDKAPDIYPYVKVWLEWVPSVHHKDGATNAVGYRLHAISLTEEVKFGKALNRILYENGMNHKDSMNRAMNSRKADPLSGLHPYQKWRRIAGLEMYIRTICDKYAGSQEYTAEMAGLLNPKIPISSGDNEANPSGVFNIARAMEKMPDSADPRFTDITSYTNSDPQDVQTLKFPSPEHMIQLTPSQLHPKTFCQKYLPDHQHWMEIQRAIPKKQLEDDYDPNCETEYDIRTPADMERARLEGLTDRSAFASLAAQAKARYNAEVLETEHTDEFPAAYRSYQEWAVHAMKTQCLDPDACISDVVSKMITWREKHSQAAIIKHTITDHTLSVFANRTIAINEQYEQYALISTAHRMMFLIHHARYDSFRRDFGLHFNCFQAGEGATSKSFLFKLMEWMSIPGSVEVLTYQTGKADAVDGNRNDVTTVCHEAPPGMFRTGKNPNADSTQEAMFKEKLTSQKVTAKVWCQDEGTGRRSARLTQSECIGVWMGATNDPPSEVEEALKTRFFWGNFEQQQRRGRDIDDCMNGERMMSSADLKIRKRMFLEAKEEQYRVMLVEKGIWCKVIKDVDMTASNILVPRLKNKLTRNSIIIPGPRDWERVKIFSRCMAIVTAIERVCNLPGGKWYGKPFAEECLPDLEPYLRVTEEMVIFVLSLLSDQFRSPVEHKILKAIYNMEKRNPSFIDPNTGEQSFDYLKLPRLKQLAKKVNSRMSFEKGRTSINNIENFLNNMAKHSANQPKYRERPVGDGTSANVDKFPIEDTRKGKNGRKPKPTMKQSCVITHEGVFIHISHIMAHKEESADSIFQILSSETHAHSACKRIFTACPVDSRHFHIFKVIERQPGGDQLDYKNVLANSSISRWITQTSDIDAETRTRGGYSITTDIDAEVCGKMTTKVGKACYTPLEMMESVVEAELDEMYMRPEINYPSSLVKTKKRARDDSDSDEDVGPQGTQKKTKTVE